MDVVALALLSLDTLVLDLFLSLLSVNQHVETVLLLLMKAAMMEMLYQEMGVVVNVKLKLDMLAVDLLACASLYAVTESSLCLSNAMIRILSQVMDVVQLARLKLVMNAKESLLYAQDLFQAQFSQFLMELKLVQDLFQAQFSQLLKELK